MKAKLTVMLLVVTLLSTNHVTVLAAANPAQADWPVYQSVQMGFSLSYPTGWTMETLTDTPSEFQPQVLTVRPPTGHPLAGNQIDIAYLPFEIAEGQDLATWELLHEEAVEGVPYSQASVLQSEVLTDASGARHHLLHKSVMAQGPAQSVYLTNGRLVLAISSYTHDGAMTDLLERIAHNVTFAPNSAQTLDALWGTSRIRPSLESIVKQNHQGGGSTCGAVCQDAQDSKDLMLPAPAPLSAEFLANEQEYQELLKSSPTPALAGSTAAVVQPTGVVPVTRKALPSNWWSPIVASSGTKNVDCSSPYHTDRAAMAIDIQNVLTGDPIYAAQGGYVAYAGWYDQATATSFAFRPTTCWWMQKTASTGTTMLTSTASVYRPGTQSGEANW